MTHHTALTNSQAVSYLAIASMAGTNASGVPDLAQLQAIADLGRSDRYAIVREFSEGVKARMAPDVLALIHETCNAH